MKAIILAAGVGRRLGAVTDRLPKSLLRFGDETLLERHLRCLAWLGIEEVTVVAGHLAGQIEAAVARLADLVPVRIVLNPLYRKGSALSLLAAANVLIDSPCLLMDADLLYERELLARILGAESPNCLLVDSTLDDTGEEVKAVVGLDGRVLELGKSVHLEGRVAGESVGIFKFDPVAGRRLVAHLKTLSEADADVEYEMAVCRLAQDCDLVCVSADGLAWIEIDFPEDLERARAQVYPRLAPLSQSLPPPPSQSLPAPLSQSLPAPPSERLPK
jgi:choline kinase